MKKTVLVLLFVALSATLVFGAGTKEQSAAAGGPTTIRWAYWGSGERVTISQKAIELYESRNPGVKVNPEVSG